MIAGMASLIGSGMASDTLSPPPSFCRDVPGEVSGQLEGVSYGSIEVWSLAG